MRPAIQSVRNGTAPHTGLTAASGKRPTRTPILIPHPHAGKRKLILRCWYSLGDITLLTAAVR